MGRMPKDAFERYVAMGPSGTYAALAKDLGVSKRTVVRHASAERWQERLKEIDRKARQRTDAKLAESFDAINERHLKTLRAIQHRALQGLQSLPLISGMDCVRALALAIKAERLVLGKKVERKELTIEELIVASYDERLVAKGMDMLREAGADNAAPPSHHATAPPP